MEVATTLGRYRLEEVLGEGAVGVVYHAVRDDGREVALKLLKERLSQDEVYLHRFLNEARVAAEVQHEHLVPIIDTGEADGRHYLAGAYVRGRSLEQRIEGDGPLSRDELLRLVREVATALDALHEHGLVHRDVKPSNVVLDEEGAAFLTDFGLAKGPAYTVLTKPGQVMGTLDYLAPELIRGEQASRASDVYALGCVVFECAAGSPPFGGKSLFHVGAAHLEEEPPDPCAGRDDLSADVAWAIKTALAKDPAERPPTATAYASLLHVAAKA